jgi:hypothetical protein
VKERPERVCPISPVVDLMFSRWTTPILWVLRHHGPRLRFNELERFLGPISRRNAELDVLTDFQATALSRLAAQHSEITALRKEPESAPHAKVRTFPSPANR